MPREYQNSKRHKHPVFTVALFTIGRAWKQPKCPSAEQCVKEMWCIFRVDYCSAIKGKEIWSFVEMWMDLATVTQSEVSQKERIKHHVLTHICGI